MQFFKTCDEAFYVIPRVWALRMPRKLHPLPARVWLLRLSWRGLDLVILLVVHTLACQDLHRFRPHICSSAARNSRSGLTLLATSITTEKSRGFSIRRRTSVAPLFLVNSSLKAVAFSVAPSSRK